MLRFMDSFQSRNLMLTMPEVNGAFLTKSSETKMCLWPSTWRTRKSSTWSSANTKTRSPIRTAWYNRAFYSSADWTKQFFSIGRCVQILPSLNLQAIGQPRLTFGQRFLQSLQHRCQSFQLHLRNWASMAFGR